MKNYIEVIDWILKRWTTLWGCIITLVVVNGFIYNFFHEKEWWTVANAIIIMMCGSIFVSLYWAINTKRAFQRTRYWMFLWVSLILILSLLYYIWVYPCCIANTQYDIGGIRYWAAAMIFIVFGALYYFIDFKWYKVDDKLFVIFLVDNHTQADKQILESLKEACCRVEDACTSVRLIVAPFGIVCGKMAAERYVKSPLCQADAIIYSRVMAGNDDGDCGYVFTEFCSFTNAHRINASKYRIKDVDKTINFESNIASWNIRNRHNNTIAEKIKVAQSIEHLLRVYCICLYVIRHKLSVAIAMARNLYNVDNTQNPRLKWLAQDLLEFAYFEAEYVEEKENQDYNRALSVLEELTTAVPFISNTSSYNLAMARIMFYLNRIRDSKHYTKQTKNSVPWCYYVNMGFYAIYEGKVKEFVSHYKKLSKSPHPTKEQVAFVIDFLEKQVKQTADRQYEALLLSAIAYQTLYTDKKKAQNMAKSIMKRYPVNEYGVDVVKLLDLIKSENFLLKK